MINTVIVSDLDGTLLNSEQQIDKINEKWIRHFISDGGFFTFATGRMNKSIQPYIEKLGVEIPVISYNGAKIFCPLTGKLIHEELLHIPELVPYLMKNYGERAGIFVFKDEELFICKKNRWTEAFEQKEKLQCLLVDEGTLNANSVTKVLCITDNLKLLEEINRYISNMDYPCRIVYSESNYLEILPLRASKGNGLMKLMNYMGWKNFSTIGIGDYLNDLSLLDEADIGIAVAEAHQELKAKADIVLPYTNDQNAIAWIIRRLMADQQGCSLKDHLADPLTL